MSPIIKLLRPHQYIKNGFVLLGLVFSQQWSFLTLTSALTTFCAFCAIASAVYVLNDIMDLDADREHPVKRKRPLPSGLIPVSQARKVMIALVISALLLSLTVSLWVTLFISIYFVMNILYSWRLKHVVILDVFIISAGFMLRILAGTVGLGIAPSAWLLLCGLMVTLLLGFSKRRAELLMIESSGSENGNMTRKVLDDYSPAVLEQFISVTAACTILSYGLYTVSPATIALHNSEQLIYTLPFVIYGIFRYLFLLHHRAKGNDTARDLMTDFHLLLTVLSWIITTLWVLA
ncbi:MAG: decaprenyl-phosphate phosphoribosyltransferase [Marinobacterium sp.]|nr:decaprenyl-phosphate phosphoribosyltransferase [Marinobacterium sp.]